MQTVRRRDMILLAISKAMRAALKVLTFPDPDLKKSYKIERRIDKATARLTVNPKNCRIKNTTVERDGYEIPVRIYSAADGESKGVIMFFHGGGWVNGDIDTYDGVCIGMLQKLTRTIVSVDYRRAPEYRFPNAVEDCYAAAKKLFDGELVSGVLAKDIVLMGDSAGGNLAAAVSIMARDRGEFMPKRQILLYPVTGNDYTENSPFNSVRENGTDYLLTAKRMREYQDMYISNKEDLHNPYFCPLESENLSNQPRTLIISAEYCPLRDEAEEYGKRLAEDGNRVTVYRMPDALHGFFSIPFYIKQIGKTYTIIKRFIGDDRIAERRTASWARLDNAAKIFPPTTSRHDAKVFRIYCELNEKIDEKLLQEALDATIAKFPFYTSILKKGIFWYYLEESLIKPEVHQENREPCSRIYNINKKDLLFEVSYYKKRVNLEVFHVLTDGEGATVFFRTLIANYVQICHSKEVTDALIPDYDASKTEKKDDSFSRYYNKKQKTKVVNKVKAYQQRGERLDVHPLGVIEGRISVKSLLEKSHTYNATLTAFLVGILIKSIADGMPVREKGKTIVIDVPVNLRQYFNSKSARNFFGIINVKYNVAQQGDKLEDIIKAVTQCMKEELEADKIAGRMSELSSLENLWPARMVPVFIKDPSMKIANHIVDKSTTAAVSNIGKITMPEQVVPYIKSFGFICSTNRIQACVCSFGDNFVVGFTSPYVNTDIQCRFFRTLTQMGIQAEITSNLGSDDNVIL